MSGPLMTVADVMALMRRAASGTRLSAPEFAHLLVNEIERRRHGRYDLGPVGLRGSEYAYRLNPPDSPVFGGSIEQARREARAHFAAQSADAKVMAINDTVEYTLP